MIWLLANRKLIGYGAAVVAILSAFLWLRSHWIGVGEERVEIKYQRAWAEAQAEAARVRVEDQERSQSLANTLEALGNVYADLRAQPPVILTQTREVKVSEACTCPVVSLGPDFLQRYNAASSNP